MAWEFRDLERGLEMLWKVYGRIRGTYNARCIGPAIVETVLKRRLRCSEMRNNRVSSTVRMKRKGDERLISGENQTRNAQESDNAEEEENNAAEVDEPT